jgi:hypothetical protein
MMQPRGCMSKARQPCWMCMNYIPGMSEMGLAKWGRLWLAESIMRTNRISYLHGGRGWVEEVCLSILTMSSLRMKQIILSFIRECKLIPLRKSNNHLAREHDSSATLDMHSSLCKDAIGKNATVQRTAPLLLSVAGQPRHQDPYMKISPQGPPQHKQNLWRFCVTSGDMCLVSHNLLSMCCEVRDGGFLLCWPCERSFAQQDCVNVLFSYKKAVDFFFHKMQPRRFWHYVNSLPQLWRGLT